MKTNKYDDLLTSFDPSDMALFDWLKVQMTDGLLQYVAYCDPGGDDHYRALLRLRDKNNFGFDFDGGEALCLDRWHKPYDPPKNKNMPSLTEQHTTRAFSCASLLIAHVKNDYEIHCASDVLAPLVESCIYLGDEAVSKAISLIAWMLLTDCNFYEDVPFYYMALLLLSFDKCKGADEELIKNLLDAVIEIEQRFRTEEHNPYGYDDVGSPWLLGLTIFDQYHHLWITLSKQLDIAYKDHVIKDNITLILSSMSDYSEK